MPRTKVFYFIPNLQQGGVEGQILELINRLPPRFEPVLCVYHGDNVFWDKCPPGQPAHDLGVRRMNLGALDKLTDILLREKPAIVHSYRDKANFWARWAASRAGVPITITGVRNRMMALRYLATEWYLQRKSSVILANSIGVKHELVRWARVRDDKVRVIYNLLDVDFFRPPTAAERAEARARWQLAPDARALLLPGRMGIQKHQLGLLAAMRALARRGKWPKQAVVMFAGRARDKLTSALVRWFARQPELANAVRLLEAVKDIRSLYWASDLLVMPSLYEGLANAGRLRDRPARDPIARRQRRRHRAPRRDRLGGGDAAPRPAGARAGRSPRDAGGTAGRDGSRRPRARGRTLRAAAGPRTGSDGRRLRRAAEHGRRRRHRARARGHRNPHR